jgi:hypothetical protein
MYAVTLLLATAAPAADTAPAPRAAPTADDVRAAAGKALGFLDASSAAWRAERKCVTCHQVPFTLWAFTIAKARGLAVDGGKLDDLTAWAFNFCATDEHKGEKTGGFHLTTAFMVLSQAGTAPRADALKAYPFFETLFAKRQKADGSWREGRQVKLPGAEREADEVDTMWTLLAIRELEQLGDRLPADTHKGLATERAKGLAFLKDAKPGRRVDWLALRGLVARAYGTPAEADALVAELRGVQNADGGWGYVRGGESFPQTTGEVLFALAEAGVDGSDATVRRAWRYLLAAQRPDGTWDSRTRESFASQPGKMNDVTVHWGTAWAAIGLLYSLPR